MRIYAVIATIAILFAAGSHITEAISTADATEATLTAVAYGGFGAYASALSLWLAFAVLPNIE